MPAIGQGRERRSLWGWVLHLLTLVLLLPVLPLFGVVPGGGGGGDGAGDDDEDPDDSDGGGGGDGDGGGDDDDEDDEDDEFDRERAMATIRKQRALEKAQKKELADALKKVKALEAAEKKRSEAELSELELAQAKVVELEQAKADAESQAQAKALEVNEKLIKAEVRLVAGTMGFVSPGDAYQLAELADVSVDDEGEVKGVEKALKALAKDKPYLLEGEKGTGGVGTPPRGGKRSSSKGEQAKPRVNF